MLLFLSHPTVYRVYSLHSTWSTLEYLHPVLSLAVVMPGEEDSYSTLYCVQFSVLSLDPLLQRGFTEVAFSGLFSGEQLLPE